ncbi:hypothetical protein T265_15877, partial [Opisthorchis viverrini]
MWLGFRAFEDRRVRVVCTAKLTGGLLGYAYYYKAHASPHERPELRSHFQGPQSKDTMTTLVLLLAFSLYNCGEDPLDDCKFSIDDGICPRFR